MSTYVSVNESPSWAGETIGIMVLNCKYPFIPGNVANATTFDFPVQYREVQDADVERLLFQADPELIQPFIDAARSLECSGVKAITGACGFMALFQKDIQAAVSIPVFSSSLLQIPFIYAITGKRVGIITAASDCLKTEHFVNTSVPESIPLAIQGMENCQAFYTAILQQDGKLDSGAIERGVINAAEKLLDEHKDIGAILLECSDLPPYAHAVQKKTNLPVFDFITMIEYVHSTLVRKPYIGLI